MKKLISTVVCFLLIFPLAGCRSYSEEEMRRIRSDAYDAGYADGQIDGWSSRFDEALSRSRELDDHLSKIMIMIEDYPEYSLEDIYSEAEQAWEACHDLEFELYD